MNSSKNKPGPLAFASEALRAKREVVLAAVTARGASLEVASPELAADKGIVLAAVSNDGGALAFASPDLQGDEEVVMRAIAVPAPRPAKGRARGQPAIASAAEESSEQPAKRDRSATYQHKKRMKACQSILESLLERCEASWPAEGHLAADVWALLIAEEIENWATIHELFKSLTNHKRFLADGSRNKLWSPRRRQIVKE